MICKLPEKCWCFNCRKLYDANRYKKEKVTHRKKISDRKIEIRKIIQELKSSPCKDCGNKYHWCAMQYDHLRDKKSEISAMIRDGISLKNILSEIDKCDLVCANCHAIRTYKRRLSSTGRADPL